MKTSDKDRARDRIFHLASRGLDAVSFFREVDPIIASAVPSAGMPTWFTLDPASLLITSYWNDEFPELEERLLRWEYFEDDVNKALDVARSPRGVSTLHEATGGDPSGSYTYACLKEFGLEQEARVALRTARGEPWGLMSLVREEGRAHFDSAELDFLRTLAPLLAEGARRGLLVGEASEPDGPDAPGLVVLDEDLSVESLTPGVERWLADLPGRWEPEGVLPPSVVAVAGRALRDAATDDAPKEIAVGRVLSQGGRWLVLHGAAMVAAGKRRAAVIVEPAHPARITPLLMAAYGLTEREQEITRHVLSGDSTAEIARTLYLSPHTVQEHLKSVFEKTGVRSRRDLVGKVFFSHYEPRVRDNGYRAAVDKPVRGGPFPLDTTREG